MRIEHQGCTGPGLLWLFFPSASCPPYQQVMSFKTHDSWLGFLCDSTCHLLLGHNPGSVQVVPTQPWSLYGHLPAPAPLCTSQVTPWTPAFSFPPSQHPAAMAAESSIMSLGPSFSFHLCSLPLCPAGFTSHPDLSKPTCHHHITLVNPPLEQ